MNTYKTIKKIINLISNYTKNKIDLFNIIYKKDFDICNKIFYLIMLVILFINIFILFFNIFNINILNLYNNVAGIFKINPSLKSFPLYGQILNLIYLNDWFSIDATLLYTIFNIIICFLAIFILYFKANIKEIYTSFNYILIILIILFISLIIYYIYNYNNITAVSKKNHKMMDLIYNNINIDYINNGQICNYFNNLNNNDNFEYGKCNFINSNFKDEFTLNTYIYDILNKINNTDININNISLSDFKLLKDENGVFYYNKIIKTYLTHTIIKYFITNNLINEASDFFSINNITNTSFFNKNFKSHLNPFLYLKKNDLSFLKSNYTYDDITYMSNSKLYYSIIHDYYNLENSISNNIIDIYNILKTKMISLNILYNYIALIIIIIMIYYIINNYQ